MPRYPIRARKRVGRFGVYRQLALVGGAVVETVPVEPDPNSLKTFVKAHQQSERILNSQSWGPLAFTPVVTLYDYKTYVEAYDADRPYGGKYYVQRLLDLKPPSVKKSTAFDLPQNLLGTRGKVERRDRTPFDIPSMRVRAHEPKDREFPSFGIEGAGIFALTIDDIITTKVTAFELPQRLLGPRYYTFPAPVVVGGIAYQTYVRAHEPAARYKISISSTPYPDFKPPSVYRVIAHEPRNREFPSFGIVYFDVSEEQIFSTKVAAFDLPQQLLGVRYTLPTTTVVGATYDYKTYVKAHNLEQKYGARYYIQRLLDLAPPSVQRISAFDLPQKLLGTRGKLERADITTEDIYRTLVRAHDPEQRYGARYIIQRLYDLQPPSVQRVSAFDYEQRYGGRAYEVPAAVVVNFYPPYSTYVKAHDPEQRLLGPRAYIQRLLDLQPPSVEKVSAFSYDQTYGARYYIQRLLDLAPPSVRKVTAFDLDQFLLGTREYLPFPDRQPPSVQRVSAFDIEQFLLGTRYKLPFADVAQAVPPEVHYVKAFDLEQFLLGTREYLPFPDRQPPQVVEVREFTLPQFELGPRTYSPPFTPQPPITSHVTAFDLPQQLLGTRAYIQRLLDLAPPEVHKIEAHTFEYRYGARQTGIILPEIVNYYPPYSTYVKAHDPTQFYLGTRAEYPPFPDRKPTYGKATAFTLPETMLGPRAYVQRLFDLKPPSVTEVQAFSYERLYGARQSGITLPEFINFYPPSYTRVMAHDPEQKLLGTRSELPFPDRYPPDVHVVKAFDLEQFLLGTRFDLPFPDRQPPSVTTVDAFELPQKPLLPRFIVVTPDRKPPEQTFVTAHDPIHKLLGSRYFLPGAFIVVTYGTPYEALTSISATAAETYESLFGVTTQWIDPYEALQGVRSTWADPYEALVGISSALNNPYESSGTGILSIYTLPWEAIVGLSTLLGEPYESLQGITASKIEPYEALRGISSSYSTPYEAIALLSSLKILPYESVQRLTNVTTAVYEALQGVASQKQYPWEANLGFSSTYTEWYEARGQVTNDLILPYEALQSISKTFADQPYEVLLGLALTGQLPWESASTIVPQHMFEAVLYAHWYIRAMKHLEARIFTRYATEPKQGRRYPNP